jgi:hypothetical protein
VTLPETLWQLVEGQSEHADVANAHPTGGEMNSISTHSKMAPPGQPAGGEHVTAVSAVKQILLIPPSSTWTSKAIPWDVSPW